jgi:hypothetical protein
MKGGVDLFEAVEKNRLYNKEDLFKAAFAKKKRTLEGLAHMLDSSKRAVREKIRGYRPFTEWEMCETAQFFDLDPIGIIELFFSTTKAGQEAKNAIDLANHILAVKRTV